MEREGIHGSALGVSMLRSCQACDGWLTSLCSNSPLNSSPPCFCKFVKVVSTEHHKKEETRCSSALKSRQYSKIIFICARKYGSLMFLSSADVHIFHSELIPSLPSYIFPRAVTAPIVLSFTIQANTLSTEYTIQSIIYNSV